MAIELGIGYVNILPSTKGLGKSILGELSQAQRAAEPEASKAGQKVGKKMGGGISSGLKTAIAAAGGLATILGVGALAGSMKDSIMKAGDFEQSAGAVQAVFKGSAGQIEQFGADVAKTLGMSKNEWYEFSTLLGSQLKNGGTSIDELSKKTISLGKLSADLASMFGGTASEAGEAISSALKGETDPIEKYGISLNMAKIEAEAAALGFEKVGTAYEDNAKQAAVLSLIQKQSADATGNFSRETGTFAHQLQVLGAQWDDFKVRSGETFLPVLTAGLTWLNNTGMPILTEISDGFRAFRHATMASWDGLIDVTSSGFPGFMERIGNVVGTTARVIADDLMPKLDTLGTYIKDTVVTAFQDMHKWVNDNKLALEGIAVVVGAFASPFVVAGAAIGLYNIMAGIATIVSTAFAAALSAVRGAATTAAISVMLLNEAFKKNLVVIVILAIVGAIAALIAGLVWAYKNVEWFRDMVNGAWAKIKAVVDAVWPSILAVITGVWGKIQTVVGAVVDWFNTNVAPIISSVMTVVGQKFTAFQGVVAVVWDAILSKVRSFVDWWAENVAPKVIAVLDKLGATMVWLNETIIQPAWTAIRFIFAIVAGIIIGFIILIARLLVVTLGPAFKLAWSLIKQSIEGWKIIIGAFVSWWTDTAWPAILKVINWLGDKWTWIKNATVNMWTAIRDATATQVAAVVARWNALRDGVTAVWTWVSDKTAVAVAWIKSKFVQLQIYLAFLGAKFRELYNTYVRPVIDWITDKINKFATWFMTNLWPRIKDVLDRIGRGFKVMYDAFIKPVWDWVSARIDRFKNWFMTNIWPAIDRILGNIGRGFKIMYERFIKPAWDSVSSKVMGVWNWIKSRAFDPLQRMATETIPNAFGKMREAISKQWDRIKKAFKDPIRVIIDTVNDPFISSINWVMDKVKIPQHKLSPLKYPAGFATGGYTGRGGKYDPAGIVHADEYVIRKESQNDLRKRAPGFLDRLNKEGASALPTFGHSGHAAHGGAAAGGPGGPGTYLWGALQNRIYASGKAHVTGSAPGYDLRAATRAWNNMSNLKLRYGRGENQITVGSGAPAGTWGYAWTDGRIQLNPGIPSGMKVGTAAHEIGHVLGLDHAGTNSIMHPMMRGPLWPSAFDRASIQRIYGGSGKGNPPEGGGGFSLFDTIMDKVTSPFKGLADKALDKFEGSIMGQIGSSVLKTIGSGGIDWIKGLASKIDLFDNGGLLHKGVQLIDHQRSTPDKVLTDQQWRAMYDLATTERGTAGAGYQFGDIHGYTAEEVAVQFDKKLKRREALSAS